MTAQRILILEAKLSAYQDAIDLTVDDSEERDQLLAEKKVLEKDLKKTKRKLFWRKIQTPLVAVGGFFVGYFAWPLLNP